MPCGVLLPIILGEGINAGVSTERRLGVTLPLCKESEHDNLNKTPIGSGGVALAACFATHRGVGRMRSKYWQEYRHESGTSGSGGGEQAIRAMYAGQWCTRLSRPRPRRAVCARPRQV